MPRLRSMYSVENFDVEHRQSFRGCVSHRQWRESPDVLRSVSVCTCGQNCCLVRVHMCTSAENARLYSRVGAYTRASVHVEGRCIVRAYFTSQTPLSSFLAFSLLPPLSRVRFSLTHSLVDRATSRYIPRKWTLAASCRRAARFAKRFQCSRRIVSVIPIYCESRFGARRSTLDSIAASSSATNQTVEFYDLPVYIRSPTETEIKSLQFIRELKCARGKALLI